ncbi:MAG: formate/nitrite transporter family protein [Geminicoccaceae bacterium]|nr:formate/nitrite transporter family protein [Geminicoccaceae bacterium]MCX7631349.1 formate/nitrite transporter family protein [Geminicoccaceae bacterium]MDW8125314.1 formate/nitrite transporter family protein [Geminicoccaceae bacterium]MDW8342443.1 formate/nitrite transporter family protein [Geminicoccaceae bacterium]
MDLPPSLRLPETLEIDAYAPAQIAERVERAGVAKARLPLLQTFTLGVLGGAFIALGALYFTLVLTGAGAGFGPARLLGGVAFSLGMVMVVVAGAELFTGNNLLVMAWVEGRISLRELLRNWAVVYVANFAGAFGLALFVWFADALAFGGGQMIETAAAIARAKVALEPVQAFFRGILCNVLVCMAVWLSFAAREVTGKILAVVFPISAFVALGFENSIANMYLVPVAMLYGVEGVDLAGFFGNLIPVTFGNMVGGGGLVALAYWLCYRFRAGEGSAFRKS